MEKDNAAKEENFKLNADRLRKQFMDMPLGVLLVVQGLIVEVAEAKNKGNEG